MTDPRLKIDIYDLDTALLENPSLVQQIGDEAAIAIAIRDTKKDELETVEAKLFAEIREELSKDGGKATEATIKAEVQVNPRRKHAFIEYNNAKLAAAKATVLEKAAVTRSDAMKELSRLYTSGYYAIDSTKKSQSVNELQYNKSREQLAAKRLQK